MDWLCLGLTVTAFATGLYAAQLWWQASRIPVVRKWEANSPVEDTDSYTLAHLFGLIDAVDTSSKLNATAAKWTAIAVCTGSVGTLISILKELPVWKG